MSHLNWLAPLSVGLALFGLISSFLLYRKKSEEKHLPAFEGLVFLLKEKFFFDRVYDWLITNVQENIA